MSIVLDIENLSFGYSRDRLLYDDFSLTLNRGEILSIVGESGSGKSTLFELISDNLKPLQGEIKKGKIAWVFQDPYSSFHPSYSIKNQIADVASIEGIESLARDMDIDISLLSQLPHQLSGGQLQRCSILRALLMNPDLILCDEPTSALDNIIQLDVMKILVNHLDRVGVLLITHDIDLANWASDRVISLDSL